MKPNPDNWHTVLPYESQYTEEDHVQRICDRLETTSNRRGENFDVYILYSFNDKPEYYLIQKYIIKLNEDGDLTKTYSSFFIGYIENDEYYVPGSELGGGLWKEKTIIVKPTY